MVVVKNQSRCPGLELRSYNYEVEVAVLSSPSLILMVLMVSVDVKQHGMKECSRESSGTV